MVPSPSEVDSAANISPSSDPDLIYIIAAWTDLPPAIKAGMIAMVKSAMGPKA